MATFESLSTEKLIGDDIITWTLKQTTQCAKCPWKVSTDPYDIPNGYEVEKHQALKATLAEPGALDLSSTLPAMACHETHDTYCIGWMAHQLGRGNNIPLRLKMMTCTNIKEMRIVGDQHPNFESTLPR